MKNSLSAIFLLLFFSAKSVAQTLTVSPAQLDFGDVFENSPDSLQLTITNNLGKPVTITGIKFYDTYGVPAFSTTNSWYSIANGNSVSIWVRFSPRHNIMHNSELVIVNDGLRGNVSVDLIGQGKYSNHYYDPSENFSEENLKNIINVMTGNGYVSLGYNVARDSMFMSFDNKRTNGQGASQNTLECVYTGREAVGYTSRTDCQTNFSFNTEHTFPQSLFSSMEPMRSDLHHLFPTDDAANNERGDNPFGVVTSPSWSNGGSLSDGVIFEPRNEQKGLSARALFYFTLRYQNYSNFLNSQESILRMWHTSFPPDLVEQRRNDEIYALQLNRNPFVDYPMFIERINSLSSNSVAPLVSAIDLTEDTIIFGTIQVGTPVDYNFVIVNNGNTPINITNLSLTHPTELSFVGTGNDTILSTGESLPVQIRCLVSTTDSIRAFLTFNSNATGNTSVTVPIFVNDLIFSAISEEEFPGLVISPNPASDYVKISWTNQFEKINFEFFDIAGRKIIHGNIDHDSMIDISEIGKGFYLLRLSDGSRYAERKIILR